MGTSFKFWLYLTICQKKGTTLQNDVAGFKNEVIDEKQQTGGKRKQMVREVANTESKPLLTTQRKS
jgi:hypothetical protein